MRRETTLTAAVALALVAVVPAYDRVFSDPTWRAPALLSAGAALGVAVLCRRLRRGAVVAAVMSVVALSLLTIMLHLSHAAFGIGAGDDGDPGVLGALAALVSQGLVELRETPAPAPPLPGLMLFVSSGFWVIAHLAHELAVRRRSVGLALVPVLVLWAAPLVVPMAPGRTWPQALPFLAAAGLALLLGSDPADPEPSLPGPGLSLGAMALCVAILMPGLLPGYGQSAWVSLTTGTDPRGYQPIVDISRRLQLPEERDVLLVRSEHRSYLRLAGLDHFDGFTWRLGPPGQGSYRPDPGNLYSARNLLPFEEPAAESVPLFADIEVLALENIYVPIPYQPVQVLGPARDGMVWSTDGGFLATWDQGDDGGLAGEPHAGVRQGLEYRVQAARPAPSTDQLRDVDYDAATIARWTQLPRDYDELAAQAQQVYDAAGATSAVEQALALQNWFGGRGSGFTYSLDVPALRDDGALERFVLEDRVGYCEYYATAMAVMLRATGIPARVAVGFLPGRITAQPDREAGEELYEFTVSTADAHAWVEVLFPGYGWITFEPTPRSDGTQIVPTFDNLAPVENERDRRIRELEALGEGLSNLPVPDSPDLLNGQQAQDGAAGQDGAGGAGSGDVPAWIIGAALLAIVIATRRIVLARRRHHPGSGRLAPHERVLRAQRRLMSTARAHGLGRRPSETSREVLRRWRQEGRINGESRRFARLSQAAAFGGDVDAAAAAEAERLVVILEEELRESVDARARLFSPLRVPTEVAVSSARRTVDRLWRRQDAMSDQ